jgi:NhaP-type Na+/H+ or K+/H+ antiporter
MGSLTSGAFTGGGLVIGVAIGLALYYFIRRGKNGAADENSENSL